MQLCPVFIDPVTNVNMFLGASLNSDGGDYSTERNGTERNGMMD